MAMPALPANASAIVGVVLLLLGLALAFFGERIWEWLCAVVFSTLLGFGLFALGMMFLNDILYAAILGVVGFIAGSLFGKFLAKGAMAMSAAFIGFILGSSVAGPLAGAALGAVLFVVVAFLLEKIIAVITAVVGAILAGLGLYLWQNSNILLAGIAIPFLAVAGAWVQTRRFRKRGGRE